MSQDEESTRVMLSKIFDEKLVEKNIIQEAVTMAGRIISVALSSS
jgi:hypothetical protein